MTFDIDEDEQPCWVSQVGWVAHVGVRWRAPLAVTANGVVCLFNSNICSAELCRKPTGSVSRQYAAKSLVLPGPCKVSSHEDHMTFLPCKQVSDDAVLLRSAVFLCRFSLSSALRSRFLHVDVRFFFSPLQHESEKLQTQLASVRSQQSREAEKHQLLVNSLTEQLKG